MMIMIMMMMIMILFIVTVIKRFDVVEVNPFLENLLFTSMFGPRSKIKKLFKHFVDPCPKFYRGKNARNPVYIIYSSFISVDLVSKWSNRHEI